VTENEENGETISVFVLFSHLKKKVREEKERESSKMISLSASDRFRRTFQSTLFLPTRQDRNNMPPLLTDFAAEATIGQFNSSASFPVCLLERSARLRRSMRASTLCLFFFWQSFRFDLSVEWGQPFCLEEARTTSREAALSGALPCSFLPAIFFLI